MFGFGKRIFVSAMMFFGYNLSSMNLLECVSMNNQKSKVKPEVVNINSDQLFSIGASRCSGSCNSINDSYAKLCVPDVVKNLNAKFFNLMSRTNETRHLEWHEMCKCKCRLDSSIFNNK